MTCTSAFLTGSTMKRSPQSSAGRAGRLQLHLCIVASFLFTHGLGFQQPPSISAATRQSIPTTGFEPFSIRKNGGALHVLLDEKTESVFNKKDNKANKKPEQSQPNSPESDSNINELSLEELDAAEATMIMDNDKMKITMLALCWGVACLSALDRVAMSVALVPLGAEFSYTDTMKGAVSSLFSVGYGLGIIPAGLLLATASPRIAMGYGIALWSLATIATPQAAAYSDLNMAPLLLARASVGAAESLVVPTIQRLLSSWTIEEEKSASLAKVFSGFHAGTVGAYVLSPIIIDFLGDWRNIFFIYGGLGLFWLVPWLALSKDSPETQPLETSNATVKSSLAVPKYQKEEKQWDKSIESLKEAPWGDFIRSKGSWAMLLAHCANNWGLYNTLAWSPTFYSEQYGLNVRDSALLSVLPSIAGAFGGLIAGSLADNLLKNIDEETSAEDREQRITNIRKGFQGSALFVPALALFTLSSHIPEYPWVAQFLLMGTTGFQAFNAAGYLAANQEKAGPKWAGLLYSVTSLPAVMCGTLGVYATGRILDLTHQEWSSVFALNAGVNLLGAAAFVALYDAKREFD